MGVRRARTVGLRALQICALFLAGACGASFYKSAHLTEKHLPGQTPAADNEPQLGQHRVSSTVVAAGTHHRELQRVAQKVALQARDRSQATNEALQGALLRGQTGLNVSAVKDGPTNKQSSRGKAHKSSKRGHRKHAKAKKQPATGPKGSHLDVPLEEVGLSSTEVVELRARNEQERQARLAEVRAQFYKRRPGLSEAEPGAQRADEMVLEEVARARDTDLFKVFSKKHGLSFMRRQRHAKRPESLRQAETAVAREARKMVQTVEADETRCAKLPDSRSVRVVVAGMSDSGRVWLLTAVRALLEASFGGQEVAGSWADGIPAVNASRALEILSASQYAAVAVEGYDAKLLAAADYVFLAHQDPRSEFAERVRANDGARAPPLHRAFQEHAKWQPHACTDGAREHAAADALDAISRLATMLCLPGVDPGEIAAVVGEEVERSGYEAPGTLKSENEVAYRKPALPNDVIDRIEQSFGAWMAMHGYPVKNQAGQAGLVGANELLSGNVLRVQNCPRMQDSVSS